MTKNHRATSNNKSNSRRIIQNLRQSMYDPSIQIGERNAGYEQGEMEKAVNKWMENTAKNSDNEKPDPAATQNRTEEMIELKQALREATERETKNLIMVCNGIWRIRQNINLSVTEQPTPRLQRTKRHVDTLVEQIGNAGYTFKDHTGEPYDTGNQVIVLSTEPTDGLTSDRVIETVKPSVFFKGDLIQSGEVIIGTPINA